MDCFVGVAAGLFGIFGQILCEFFCGILFCRFFLWCNGEQNQVFFLHFVDYSLLSICYKILEQPLLIPYTNYPIQQQSNNKPKKIEKKINSKIHHKMSLLSVPTTVTQKTQYTKICNNLEQMQEQISEQSNNICNKISLALCKIDCVKQVLQQENQNHLHEGADRLIQVRERVSTVKDFVADVSDKYSNNAKIVFQELTQQLTGLQTSTCLNRANRIKQQKAIQEKLDQGLSLILEQATQQHEQELKKIKKIERQLLTQLRGCEQDVLNSRKEMQSEEMVLLGKIEEIGKDLHAKVKMLRDSRKSKKNNFLDLLESVIDKVQDFHVVKI